MDFEAKGLTEHGDAFDMALLTMPGSSVPLLLTFFLLSCFLMKLRRHVIIVLGTGLRDIRMVSMV